MTSLSIKCLRKSYSDKEVLKGIDLDIKQGEFVSLLGPSGCGKTTTLRCVAGFEFPDSGHILFGSEDMTRFSPEKRDVGMVFQSYALFPHMTVRENLSFGLEMRSVSAADRDIRIAEILEMVQLNALEQRYPRELSGGQQQRVALARALVIEPSVLLLDEPLANLDAALRDDMRFFIRGLQQRVGITSIYVTHDQSEAIVMSDRIVVMFDGRIAQIGTPHEIYNAPTTRQVAEFVGRSNFVEAQTSAILNDGLVSVSTPYGDMLTKCAPDTEKGTTGSLMIRPESLLVGSAQDGANVLKGKVVSSVFLGDGVTLTLRLSDGKEFIVSARPDLNAQPGDALDLSVAPENVWFLQ